jgi:hypothetical protein
MESSRSAKARLRLAKPDGDGKRGSPAGQPGHSDLPAVPALRADAVSGARAHLTGRYAGGGEALLWQTDQRPLPDPAAIRAVIRAAARGEATGADFTAGFIVAISARLDLDRLEAGLFEAALEAGLSWEAVAVALSLPSADSARNRYNDLSARLLAPAAATDVGTDVETDPPGLGAPASN